MTRRVNDFDKFMGEHVNLNPSRYERLKRSDKAISEYLGQNLAGYRRASVRGPMPSAQPSDPSGRTMSTTWTAWSIWITTGPSPPQTTLTMCTGV